MIGEHTILHDEITKIRERLLSHEVQLSAFYIHQFNPLKTVFAGATQAIILLKLVRDMLRYWFT